MKYIMSHTAAAVAALALAAPGVLVSPALAQGSNGAGVSRQAARHLTVGRVGNRVSINADNADVQSVLVRLFMKMDRQLIVDQSVGGSLGLHITGATFDAALKAICREAHLVYRYNPATKVYTISMGQMAARKGAGAEVAEQYRASNGEDDLTITPLPAGTQQQTSHPLDNAFPTIPQGVPNSNNLAGVVVQNPPPNGVLVIGHLAGGSVMISQGAFAVVPSAPNPGAFQGYSGAPQGQPVSPYSAVNGPASAPNPMNTVMAPMPDGHPVYFDIPANQAVPVASLLQRLGREAGIPVAVDDSVPANARVAVSGTLSPKRLAAALDSIASAAHLVWRWNGYEAVVTAPASHSGPVLQPGVGVNANPGQ